MVEHSLCMRGAGGSIPPTSIVLFVFSYLDGILYSALIIKEAKSHGIKGRIYHMIDKVSVD